MIDSVTKWFEIAQYEYKRSTSIENLVNTTWLSIYPRPIEITYDQGKVFIGHELRKSLIKIECRTTSKPSTLGNTMYNSVLERIHQVLVNLVRNFNISTQTYVGENDPWAGILAAAAFAIHSTTNMQKGYSPGQLIFGLDMILPIKHRVDWELISQKKQTQVNRDNIQDNKHRVDYEYKVRDKVILTNHNSYKYETPYKVPFLITQCLPMAR